MFEQDRRRGLALLLRWHYWGGSIEEIKSAYQVGRSDAVSGDCRLTDYPI
jgi:hypothetical protein